MWIRGMTLAVAASVGMTACTSSPELAKGPIDIGEQPNMVRFHHPVNPVGPTWELCFEFDLPRDSHRASEIEAALVSTTGDRTPLIQPSVDRRGESTVCQIVRLSATSADRPPTAYEAVELTSHVPMRLRRIRGGSR